MPRSLRFIRGANKRRKGCPPEVWEQHKSFILELDEGNVKLDSIVKQLKTERGFDVNKTQLHAWLIKWRGMRRGPYQTSSRPLTAEPASDESTLPPTTPLAISSSGPIPDRVSQTPQRPVATLGISPEASALPSPYARPQSAPRDDFPGGGLPTSYISLADVDLRSTRHSTTTEGVDHTNASLTWEDSFQCTDSSLTRPDTHNEGKSIRSMPSFEAGFEQTQAQVPGQSLVGTGELFLMMDLDSDTVYVRKIPDDNNYILPAPEPTSDPVVPAPNPTLLGHEKASPTLSMILVDGDNSQMSRVLLDTDAGDKIYLKSHAGDEPDAAEDVFPDFGSLSISESGSTGDRRASVHRA